MVVCKPIPLRAEILQQLDATILFGPDVEHRDIGRQHVHVAYLAGSFPQSPEPTQHPAFVAPDVPCSMPLHDRKR
jgi:hypothetical protein